MTLFSFRNRASSTLLLTKTVRQQQQRRRRYYSSFLSSSTTTKITKAHTENRILDTHPLHLFRIIQDVDKYFEFIPYCDYSRVINSSIDGRTFEGKLIVGKQPIWSEVYTSKVTVIPEELTIHAESIESTQFDSLKSCWKLKPVVETTTSSSSSSNDDDEYTDDDRRDTTTTTSITAHDVVEEDARGNPQKQQQEQHIIVDDDNTTTIQQPTKNSIRCEVDFRVELTVSNRLIIGILDQVLVEIATQQVSAFDERCKQLPMPYDLIDIATKYY